MPDLPIDDPLGQLEQTRQRDEAALADYTEAIRPNPEDALAYHNRGISYASLKHRTYAVGTLRYALGATQDANCATA